MSGIYSSREVRDLEDLDDMSMIDLSNDETIKYDSIAKLWKNAEGGGSATFTSYSSGAISTEDTQGSFVRADGNLTLPSATAGSHLTILAGSSVSNTFEEIQTITGTFTNNWVGRSNAFSTDGSVYVFGTYRTDMNGIDNAGYFSIYRRDSNGDYQLEQKIDGIYAKQSLGATLDINGAGTRITVESATWSGSQGNPPIPADLQQGFVDVYDYSNGTWSQTFRVKGSDYSSTSPTSSFGKSAISKDGNTFIIGNANANVSGGSNTGFVVVYNYNNGSWSQKGQILTGTTSNEFFGISVDVNSDGTRMAIGQSRYTSSNTGRVQVFTYNGTNWVQYGNDMASTLPETSEEFGRTVKFNEDGTRIVIGSPNKDTTNTDAGIVVVYEDQSGTWTQIGSTLSGKDNADDELGWIVDMTDDGNTILAGSRYDNSSGSSLTGYVSFYNWNGTDWDILQTIDAPAGGTYQPLSHALSRDGKYFVFGDTYFNTQAGKAIIYNKEDLNVGDKTITASSGDSINNGTTIVVSTLKQFVCSQDGTWISN